MQYAHERWEAPWFQCWTDQKEPGSCWSQRHGLWHMLPLQWRLHHWRSHTSNVQEAMWHWTIPHHSHATDKWWDAVADRGGGLWRYVLWWGLFLWLKLKISIIFLHPVPPGDECLSLEMIPTCATCATGRSCFPSSTAGVVIISQSAASAVQCLNLCLLHSCGSLYFNTRTHLCSIHSSIIPAHIQDPLQGWVFYRVA